MTWSISDRSIKVELIAEPASAQRGIPFVSPDHGLDTAEPEGTGKSDALKSLVASATRLRSRTDGLFLAFFSDPALARPYVITQSDRSRFYEIQHSAHKGAGYRWKEFYHAATYETLVRLEHFWEASEAEFTHPAAGQWDADVLQCTLSAMLDFVHDRPTHLRRIYLRPCVCSPFDPALIGITLDLLEKEKRLSAQSRRDMLVEEMTNELQGKCAFKRLIRITV